MSIEINENDFSIEIKETLSFQHHVLPIIHAMQEDAAFVDDVDEELLQKFIDMTDENWTDKQKIDILSKITDQFGRESNYDLYQPSIFDEELIRDCCNSFLEEEFEFSLEE